MALYLRAMVDNEDAKKIFVRDKQLSYKRI